MKERVFCIFREDFLFQETNFFHGNEFFLYFILKFLKLPPRMWCQNVITYVLLFFAGAIFWYMVNNLSFLYDISYNFCIQIQHLYQVKFLFDGKLHKYIHILGGFIIQSLNVFDEKPWQNIFCKGRNILLQEKKQLQCPNKRVTFGKRRFTFY